MNFIDTHTHLYDEQLLPDSDVAIQKAISLGVTKMYMPNCDSTTIEGMMALAEKWPEHCLPMMGLHPCYVKENVEDELRLVEGWLSRGRFYGVGEIGLDKYWDTSFLAQQRIAFAQQIDWALQYDLPIIIHSREATQDCIDIVRGKQNGKLRGIFHCFSGTVDEAKNIVGLGFYLGIGGVVTFKKTNLPEVIAAIGLQHIVLETDAPYLAPVPYRGKRNESGYIPLIAQVIADKLELNIRQVAAITTANAEKIFGKRAD